jgi:hypothetical protein
MSENNVQTPTTDSTEDEPVYYSPNRLSLISTIASWFSWFVLVGFIADTVIQGMGIQSQMSSQGLVLSTLIREPSFLSYVFANLLTPFFTGVALFLILQAASIGLNVVLEMDFNMRESKGK